LPSVANAWDIPIAVPIRPRIGERVKSPPIMMPARGSFLEPFIGD
jgi:hypothetical protein